MIPTLNPATISQDELSRRGSLLQTQALGKLMTKIFFLGGMFCHLRLHVMSTFAQRVDAKTSNF